MSLYAQYAALLDGVLDDLVAEGALPAGLDRRNVTVEPPRDAAHGDLATNAAMVLAKPAKTNPRALAEAIRPKLEALPKDPAVDQTRAGLFAAIGSVQLPDVIVAVDACTGFSSLLLGRDAGGKEELKALYAAVLAMGTDKTAAGMARMVDWAPDADRRESI